jgi:glutamine synthetase
MIRAGLDGIRNHVMPPESTRKNIFLMSPAERLSEGITNLPGDLREALDAMIQDPFIHETLGNHIYQHYLDAKTIEWEVYHMQVHEWEIQQYLGQF